MTGTIVELAAPGGDLPCDVPVQLWAPNNTAFDQPLPLLVVHDGGEYRERAKLTDKFTQWLTAGSVPRLRMALLSPPYGQRNEWYTASPSYGTTLAQSVIRRVKETAPTSGPIIGLGASFGALGMMACAYDHPDTFAGLVLQSTSFHHPDYSEPVSDDKRYEQLERVGRFASKLLQVPSIQKGLHIGHTCSDEPNRQGDRAMLQALSDQGYYVSCHETEGYGHNFEAWGEVVMPQLASVLRRTLSSEYALAS